MTSPTRQSDGALVHPAAHHDACCRRDFLAGSLGCGAYTMLALTMATTAARRAFGNQAIGEQTITKPFARVEQLAENAWAVISTPLGGDSTTVSNGGIIAGRDGVLVIEGFMTMAGAAWLRDVARQLTGRFPTHVALTHFHPDHSYGLGGYLRGEAPPAIYATVKTRDLLLERLGEGPQSASSGKTTFNTGEPRVIPETLIVDTSRPTVIDLGGQSVRLVPRGGHTPSDLTIEIDDPNITYCGDLFFNQLFPFFGDAIPSMLTATCRDFMQHDDVTYVPGHGSVATREQVGNYLELLQDVGDAAQRAHEKGIPAADAWKSYSIPERLGDWTKFRPDITRFAFEAWERELSK